MILGPDVSPAGLTSLSSIVQRALPVVMFLEKIRRRAGSIAVLIVSVIFLVSLPLIQIVPALLVALMSLAYLEEEGFCSVYRLPGLSSYLAIAIAIAATLGNNPWRRVISRI